MVVKFGYNDMWKYLVIKEIIMFELEANYSPTWDQPDAIEKILESYEKWDNIITLMWATGTWKTFTMANIVKSLWIPTLVISHNKTLAAQLATEFKYFFPRNAVHYFVSYFDYYQPEAYIASKDVYIEKDSSINKEIEMFRLSSMASLLTRQDVLVVSSVSALYGLWSKDVFLNSMIQFEVWKEYDFHEIKRKLIYMQYKPVQWKIEQWMFDMRWEIIDIYSSLENIVFRLIFNEKELELIQVKNSISFADISVQKKVNIWPSSQFLQNIDDLNEILKSIKNEMEERVKELKLSWKDLEANRLQKKTMYDLRMIKETGFTNWIENYSLYFDKRLPWDPPNTILDYFPDDFLLIIDESHMSIPQLKAMPSWDKSRKLSLIEHWFRLPSAIDHRPINFTEFEYLMNWINHKWLSEKINRKKSVKTLFVSATPSEYELKLSNNIVQQVIRPTWLLDPKTFIYPKSWDYDWLIKSIDTLVAKKPFLKKYFDGYEEDNSNAIKKLFTE